MVLQVAIVAVLARFEIAVSAAGRAFVGRPSPVRSSADGFLGAGFRAAGAVAVAVSPGPPVPLSPSPLRYLRAQEGDLHPDGQLKLNYLGDIQGAHIYGFLP